MQKIALFFLSLFFLLFSTVEAQKTIGIFTFVHQGVQTWDPDSVHSGIAGSEEAIIYMSQELAQLGYEVIVFGNPPKDSPHSLSGANPRFVSAHFSPTSKLDIAISWRMPHAAQQLKQIASKVYLWPHDTRGNSPLTPEEINAFDDVLWLSNWQRSEWSSVNSEFASFTKIFGNGINPEQFDPIKERKNPYSCIYASNYSRGLDKILDIWPQVKKEFPEATLDIYYGWNHWGTLTPKKEAELRAQIKNLETLGVRENGKVGHKALAKAFEQTSFWTYPCTAAETFCITALKAQLAGAVPVIFQHTGLTETVKSGFSCADPNNYLDILIKAMRNVKTISLDDRKQMGDFVLQEFTWKKIASKWKTLFEASSIQKKTVCLNMVIQKGSSSILNCLNAIKNKIDYWVILDKGSTDEIQSMVQSVLKDIPGQFLSFDCNNETYSLIKAKTDYTLFVNSNDELLFSEEFDLPHLDQDGYFSPFNQQNLLLVNNQLPWKWADALQGRLTCPEAKNLKSLPGVITSSALNDTSLTRSLSTQNEKLLQLRNAFYFAQSYLQVKDYEKALKIHESIIATNHPEFPIYPSLYYAGVLSEILNKDSDEIIQKYNQAYINNPKKAEALFRLAAYFHSKENYVLGYALAKQALLQQNPHDPIYNEDWVYDYGILFALGNCAFKLEKYEEAKNAYETILTKHEIPSFTRNEVGENLIKTKAALLKRKS